MVPNSKLTKLQISILKRQIFKILRNSNLVTIVFRTLVYITKLSNKFKFKFYSNKKKTSKSIFYKKYKLIKNLKELHIVKIIISLESQKQYTFNCV